ncbi:hypothetical protein AXF42_Ash006679 [Apostasia shenzhenica]|uniref:Sodium channel modifier 1 zinc-finger domain-containing protein n=1 Tax=Apostasia shenzhenica TaxID=1088818 RepID=A0A2I0AIV3_9ASPA|nr:hypothetical protein AXF42_Ash006679 [Apostasia shenzhenica]
MSAFGGDSWSREAQHRKRRVDDLLLSSSAAACSYEKLSNGKFACLVCPHNPVLDSPLILSIWSSLVFCGTCMWIFVTGLLYFATIRMHMKGSRHIAAETRLRERELSREEEINKRIALFGDAKGISNSTTPFHRPKGSYVKSKPLTERTRQAIRETQCKEVIYQSTKGRSSSSVITASSIRHFPSCSPPDHISLPIHGTSFSVINHNESATDPKMLLDWNAELVKRREKEMRFIAAGWKRDCHGKWFKDENVSYLVFLYLMPLLHEVSTLD